MSTMHPTEPQRRAPGWLWRFYDYVGAYTNPLRAENEMDRALLRAAMPVVAVVWVWLFHRFSRSVPQAHEIYWMVGVLVYAAAAIMFRWYLKRYPERGVHIQHVFLLLDPLFVGWSLYAEPQLLAWFLVLMLVIVVRVGFRYGLKAMRVELASAWVGALLPLVFSDFWRAQPQMSGALLMMIVSAWWLFAPLIRSAERAKWTEIERARLDSLHEALQAKSEFLTRVSHELRSPLQAIVSAIDVFEERFASDSAEAELVGRVRRGATALNTQLRDLLTLARGDVGKMEINPIPFEVGELVDAVAGEVRREAIAKGLELAVERPQEPLFVVADPARIDQVLTNLLINATRYTTVGRVMLTLHSYDTEERALHLQVSDTGPGIDKERIPTLFDPYTRFGDITRKGDGAGLGLAIVRSVLQYLGGKIAVESERNKGSVFDVKIPAELLDSEQTSRVDSAAHRVLVVDDQAEVLEAIASVVRKLGFDCDTALTVANAANLLGTHGYRTVLLDLEMPIKSGFDLAAETRRGRGPNATTKIYSISAVEVPDARRGWPFDGHLTKPITMHALQRVIAQPAPAAAAPR